MKSDVVRHSGHLVSRDAHAMQQHRWPTPRTKPHRNPRVRSDGVCLVWAPHQRPRHAWVCSTGRGGGAAPHSLNTACDGSSKQMTHVSAVPGGPSPSPSPASPSALGVEPARHHPPAWRVYELCYAP
jgi:hypothetical protein